VHTRADADLHHSSGRLLVCEGQTLTPELLLALADARITTLYMRPSGKVPPQAVEAVEAGLIPVGEPLRFALYDAAGSAVAREGDVLSERQLGALRARGSGKVFVMREEDGRQPALYQARLVVRTRDRLDEAIAAGGQRLRPARSGITLARTARRFNGRLRPVALLWDGERFYASAVAEVEGMWRALQRGSCLRQALLAKTAERIIDKFLADRNLLYAAALSPVGASPHSEHCMATAVYSLAIALNLGYNRAQARELVLASLFHDVGHMFIPARLLSARRSLSPEERSVIFRHIEHALFLSSRIDWPSDDYLIAIYQHHERASGSGYPTGYRAPRISEYASIVAVADIYRALVSARPHRPAHPAPEAMRRVIKMASVGLLDKTVVQAFARELSIYPVGCRVALSTGEAARVVASTQDPVRPWVSILSGADGVRAAQPKVLDLSKLPMIAIAACISGAGAPLTGF
jgi:HD-GYP domain-containing protein (c-di-GMP phosphodiesterase class II)